MVKKWIVILIISVILVVSCALEYNFVNKSFAYLTEQLYTYKSMLEADEENINTAENVKFLEDLHNNWHKKEKVLKGLIWHTGIKDIEVGISRITTYTEENDFTEAEAELNALIDYVKHYSGDFDLSLENLLYKYIVRY